MPKEYLAFFHIDETFSYQGVTRVIKHWYLKSNGNILSLYSDL